jgi:S-adenosylmethionine decarboxylase
MKNSQVGTHLILDFYECKYFDKAHIEKGIKQAVISTNATLLFLKIMDFLPVGNTGLAILAESHITVHTWPEKKFIAIDIFTCGKNVNPSNAIPIFRKVFQPKKIVKKIIPRGNSDEKTQIEIYKSRTAVEQAIRPLK